MLLLRVNTLVYMVTAVSVNDRGPIRELLDELLEAAQLHPDLIIKFCYHILLLARRIF